MRGGRGAADFRADEIAIEGVIRPKWREIVVEDAPGGGQRVNRINYEICVLQTLRERLRCKEVWVAGANRFRNPDEDLPADFAQRRAASPGSGANSTWLISENDVPTGRLPMAAVPTSPQANSQGSALLPSQLAILHSFAVTRPKW